jgi:hypothetical protein
MCSLIKHVKGMLWRVAVRLPYIQDVLCLKVKCDTVGCSLHLFVFFNIRSLDFI